MGRRPNLLPESARLELTNVLADTQAEILKHRNNVYSIGPDYGRLDALNEAMNALAVPRTKTVAQNCTTNM